MKARAHLPALAMVLALLATPVLGGDVGPCTDGSLPNTDPNAPFGYFGGALGGGNSAAGSQPVLGWAMSQAGVAYVQILVDGTSAMTAGYGRNRPGLSNLFPGFPGGDNVGFGARLDTTRYLNGMHQVTAKVVANDGKVTILNTQHIEFLNTTHNLVPFGLIEKPQENATLIGRCDVGYPNRFYTIVEGYALDSGLETGDHGVGYVELLIDGVIQFNTRRDCTVHPDAGGLMNCYGLVRLDVSNQFPNLKDAPNAGYRFAIDVGWLIDFGLVRGHHTLTVRAGDISGQTANIDEIPVTFSCIEDTPNHDAFGHVEIPGRLVSGTITPQGWALDLEGINKIQVFIDGQLAGDATLGFPRPEISATYPGYPNSAAPGWMYLLDTTTLANGPHRIQALVQDLVGFVTLLGEVQFTVDNQ